MQCNTHTNSNGCQVTWARKKWEKSNNTHLQKPTTKRNKMNETRNQYQLPPQFVLPLCREGAVAVVEVASGVRLFETARTHRHQCGCCRCAPFEFTGSCEPRVNKWMHVLESKCELCEEARPYESRVSAEHSSAFLYFRPLSCFDSVSTNCVCCYVSRRINDIRSLHIFAHVCAVQTNRIGNSLRPLMFGP